MNKMFLSGLIALLLLCISIVAFASCGGNDEPEHTHTPDDSGWCTDCGEPVSPTVGISYELSEDGTYAEVVSYSGTSARVNIASTYNGMPVTGISSNAFKDTAIATVIIPDSVTSIGAYAFAYCDSLTSITIPDSVRSIDSYAFAYCESIASITVPDGVTTIGSYAFTHCEGLAKITIPDSVTSIGIAAFFGCTSLTEITLPFVGATMNGSSNTHLGYIFGSSEYTYNNYYLPDSLRKVTVTSAENIEPLAFAGCINLTDVILENGVTNIFSEAFLDCSGLTSIVIPDSVTSIGFAAFSGCSGLVEMTLPFIGSAKEGAGYTYFGYIFGAKNYWSNGGSVPSSLKKVTVTAMTSIPAYAFYSCVGLTDVIIPVGVTVIEECAFSGCLSLTNITIPGSVICIGHEAFYNTDLTSIVIPSGVTTVGYEAFCECSRLASIEIPDSVTFIGDSAFSNTAYYKNAENWDNGVLYICKHLIDVRTSISGAYAIKDGTKTVAPFAFKYCLNLTDVSIPESVTSIGNEAFFGCTGLTSITVPDGVRTIGDDVFSWCTALANITVSDSVTSIGEYAFNNTEFYNNEANWDNGVLYIGKHLIEAKTTVSGKYIIKDGTLTIASAAFLGCTGLTSITIPEGVTNIGVSVFNDCSSLTSITIPDSVTSIGDGAFRSCSSLTSIIIPGGITSIGYEAFFHCGDLSSLYYKGTENGWKKILIGAENKSLTNATRYYYSEIAPETTGRYWHYDENGNIAVW